MKILYIANIRLPTEKAHGIQIMKMCEAFANEGIQVELVVPKRYTPITEDPFVYYSVKKNFVITRLSTFDTVSWGWLGFWIQTFSFVIHAARYARASSAEVIYSRDPMLFFFGHIPSSKKQIWEVHTKPVMRVIERVKKLPVHIIAISAGLRTVLVQSGISPERITVAHDAVDLDMFMNVPEKQQLRNELNLPLDQKLIAYVGKYKTMGESKGVEDIIAAVGVVHAKNPHAALLLVGLNKEEFPEVQELVKNVGLGISAHLVGHVPSSKISHYLKAADVLVMNYPNTEHYAYYMSPLKLFEYMASDVPIITSDLPSIREVLDDRSSYLTQVNDTQELAICIEEALSDKCAPEKAIQARKQVEVYTWRARAKAILDFLNTDL